MRPLQAFANEKQMKGQAILDCMTLQCNHQCTTFFGSLELCQYCQSILRDDAPRAEKQE